MALYEMKGLVLFQKKYRERDYLVKIFTDQFGKLMFLVRGSSKKSFVLQEAIQAFSMGTYIGDVRASGLSYLRDVKDIQAMTNIYGQLEQQAYASYMTNLSDVAIEDRQSNVSLLARLSTAVLAVDQGVDPATVCNMFEIKLMEDFGVAQDWTACKICGERRGVFDYSSQYHGLLCPKHFYLDERRYHASPEAIHFIRMFASRPMQEIDQFDISVKHKRELRYIIDKLYDENIGVRLKSKRFIDQLHRYKHRQVDWSKRKKGSNDLKEE